MKSTRGRTFKTVHVLPSPNDPRMLLNLYSSFFFRLLASMKDGLDSGPAESAHESHKKEKEHPVPER